MEAKCKSSVKNYVHLCTNNGKHQPDIVALDKLINRKKTFCQFAGLKQSGES